MIELTQEQVRAVDAENPVVAIDPRTREEFIVIRKETFDRLRAFVKPLARNWDNPADDDLIRKDA